MAKVRTTKLYIQIVKGKRSIIRLSQSKKINFHIFPRYSDASEGQRFLLPSRYSRSPKVPVEYVKGTNMSRYNPALRNLIPVRHENQYVLK